MFTLYLLLVQNCCRWRIFALVFQFLFYFYFVFSFPFWMCWTLTYNKLLISAPLIPFVVFTDFSTYNRCYYVTVNEMVNMGKHLCPWCFAFYVEWSWDAPYFRHVVLKDKPLLFVYSGWAVNAEHVKCFYANIFHLTTQAWFYPDLFCMCFHFWHLELRMNLHRCCSAKN